MTIIYIAILGLFDFCLRQTLLYEIQFFSYFISESLCAKRVLHLYRSKLRFHIIKSALLAYIFTWHYEKMSLDNTAKLENVAFFRMVFIVAAWEEQVFRSPSQILEITSCVSFHELCSFLKTLKNFQIKYYSWKNSSLYYAESKEV